jgi:hypothetical protein
MAAAVAGSDNSPFNLQLDVNTLDIYTANLADNNGADYRVVDEPMMPPWGGKPCPAPRL